LGTLAAVRAWVAVTPAPDEAPPEPRETAFLQEPPERLGPESGPAVPPESPPRLEAPADASEARNVTLSIGAIEVTVEEAAPVAPVPPPAPKPAEADDAAVRLRRHFYNGWGGP
jgi:hypothetical protein